MPSARTLARLLTTSRDHLGKAETLTVAAVERGVPALVEARVVVAGFQTMVRTMAPDKLDTWAARASESLVTLFTRGIVRDGAAVRAALALPGSNGQTQGQVTRLTLVKRQIKGAGRSIRCRPA